MAYLRVSLPSDSFSTHALNLVAAQRVEVRKVAAKRSATRRRFRTQP